MLVPGNQCVTNNAWPTFLPGVFPPVLNMAARTLPLGLPGVVEGGLAILQALGLLLPSGLGQGTARPARVCSSNEGQLEVQVIGLSFYAPDVPRPSAGAGTGRYNPQCHTPTPVGR